MFFSLRSIFYYLLSLLLLLLVCCTLCDGVDAAGNKNGQKLPPSAPAAQMKSAEILKTAHIYNILPPQKGLEKQSFEVSEYYSPFIVSAGDVLVVLAGVKLKSDNSEKNATIISKYIVVDGDNNKWGKAVIDESNKYDNKWTPQLAVQNEINKDGKGNSAAKGMLAAAKDNQIYLLLVNCSDKNAQPNVDTKCDFNITTGTVANNDSKATAEEEKIKWEGQQILKNDNTNDLTTYLKGKQLTSLYFGGSAVITGDGNIAFVLRIEEKENKSKFGVISSKDYKKNAEVKVSSVGNVDGCTPLFFPWGEKKIIMIPIHCTADGEESGMKKVKELSQIGNEWRENTEPFGRLLDFMQDKSDFTTTKINNISVLLFTQQKLKEATQSNGKVNKYDVHVWFTDGNRVSTAGRIATDDNITSSNLLHTKGELFALYQNVSDNKPKNITLTRLEDQLNDITSVITAWGTTDIIVRELFKSTSTDSEKFKVTDGLVGFLCDNGEINNYWKDEYYYVNATLTGGTKAVNGGFKFDGKGKNAKWPVGKLKKDQPYNLTDSGFTLVANVTIDNVVKGGKNNSVLGVVYKKNSNVEEMIGLLCTLKGEWEITVGNRDKSTKIMTDRKECQQKSTYLVVLILNKGKLSVYINGKELSEKEDGIKIEKLANITHFYFGAESNNVDTYVTVTNVLLYNRPFAESEVTALKISKKDNVAQKPENEKSKDTLRDNGTAGGSNGGDNEEINTLSSSQPETSTVRDCVGVFMCFLVLAHALCFL